jgi:arylsulfatase A-like enzyme
MAHVTRDYTDKALGWMKSHRENPFFMYLAHTMPHVKIDASSPFKGSTKRGLYGDVIAELDWYTGALLDSIKAWGLDDNTMVFFLSDNGPWGARDDAGSAYPLKGGKLTAWEGGFRVPFIVRAPGIVPPASVSHALVTSMDIMPTLVQLAGGGMPRDRVIDGRDIEPLLRMRPGAVPPHETHFYYVTSMLKAVRWGKWKLHIVTTDGVLSAGPLFDLEKDVGETTDVAGPNPAVVGKILELAKAGRADIGDNFVDGTGWRRAP